MIFRIFQIIYERKKNKEHPILAITSDYFQSEGDPFPYLKRIADAGFTHIHWCHHWATDFIYSDHEIEQIRQWLKEFDLRLLNLHASHGKEKYWVSQNEHQRLAGIELVENRIQMTARLGGDVLIIHIPSTSPPESRTSWLGQIRKSLDQLEPYARAHSVRIALENMDGDDWEMLEILIRENDPGFLGLCFDSGHANLSGQHFEHLERLKGRLIAVHLHDNDGLTDQHKIPFSGTVDWEILTSMIAHSAYQGCVNLEVVFQETVYTDEGTFLREAHLAGEQLTVMIQAKRSIL
jgi:sugar phosphate isomerase/epimerase